MDNIDFEPNIREMMQKLLNAIQNAQSHPLKQDIKAALLINK